MLQCSTVKSSVVLEAVNTCLYLLVFQRHHAWLKLETYEDIAHNPRNVSSWLSQFQQRELFQTTLASCLAVVRIPDSDS